MINTRVGTAAIFAMTLILAVTLLTAAACSQAVPAGPRPITTTSQQYTVKGEITPVTLDSVESLQVKDGHVVLHGPSGDMFEDLPADADPRRPTRHWALVTDSHVGGVRTVVFTEAESVTDVALELPEGEAPLHFEVFASRSGGEVLLLASGDRKASSASYFGYVTINKR